MTRLNELSAALQERYRLDRELGQGGMATVYLAHDVKHDRDVALKVLRPELAAVLGRERFLAEIHLTAKLDHPHILTLIDSGETDAILWYVVPFIRGESLRQKLERDKQLGVEEALAITRQVAGALDYAHRQGVIHRDIKPENILLQEGQAVLADFGIALAVKEAGGNRLTETGLSLGTPQYMSPEQATGDRQLDARSDVYSLGAVLYEMLAGEPPHSGPTVQAIIAKLMTERPTRLRVVRDTVPEGVDNAVAKALAKVPPDRFQDVAAFARALEAGPVAASRQPAPPWGRIAGGLLVVTALTVGALLLRYSSVPAGPREYDRVQLTSSGKASSPLLSPDGSQVAYAIGDCDETRTCNYRIVLRDIATGAERPLVENLGNAYPTQWSADGVRLLYYTWGRGNAGGTYALSRLGGTPTYLGLGAGGFLNGGDTAVVAAQLGATSTVYLRRFVLPSSRPLDSISVTEPVNLTTLSGLSISPDGRWTALAWFGGGGNGLLTLHSRSGALSSSAKVPPGFLQLCWSPDSRALYVPAAVQGREGSILRFNVDPATGRFVAGIDTISIASGFGTLSHLALSGDGRSLVYQSDREGETVMWTLARPSSGGPPRPVRRVHSASSGFDGFIPRDGGVVYYSEKTQVSGKLLTQWFAAPFDSGAGHPITPPLDGPIDITSTHDGSTFFTATRSPGGGATITAYDVATGASRPFSREASDRVSIWESAAGGVVVISGGGDSLRILDGSGREVQRVIIPDSIPKLNSLFWSPDGRDFVIYPQAPVAVGSDGNFEVKLYRVSVADGSFHLITSLRVVVLVGKTWTGDGYLHFIATTAADPRERTYRLRPQGGTPEDEGLEPFGEDGSCSMAGDGRRWACVVYQPLSDLYLIRNFDSGGR